MLTWAETIDITDIWRGTDLLFDRRDMIVARIKASAWYQAGDTTRSNAVDALTTAATADEFDAHWARLCTFWDHDNVWINRFG